MNSVERTDFDVIVVGAGSAGLCAAIAARERETSVLLLEKSPRSLRGGNGRFTRGGMMIAHKGTKDPEILALLGDFPETEIGFLNIKPNSEDEFYALLMRQSKGLADPVLCERLVKDSKPTISWLRQLGITLQLSQVAANKAGIKTVGHVISGVIGTRGGGEALIEQLFNISETKGVEIRYDTKAIKLLKNARGKVVGIKVQDKEGLKDIYAGSVVLAAGGFEANSEMRVKYLGPKWDVVKIRGSKYNTGETLNMALEVGAQSTGTWSSSHSTLIDLSAPDFGGGADTARDAYTWGIMVNRNGQRFTDEGEDWDPFTYAQMGGRALMQPDGFVYEIFDAKVTSLLPMPYQKAVPIEADSIEELAQNMDIDPDNFIKTVNEFNRATQGGKFNPDIRDGQRTKGISPVKSNWAQTIDTPPFRAYPATCGMTFTLGGIKTDKEARVLDTEGNLIAGLYAAGAIVGGFYYYNYAPATGITKNVVFGRIAGNNAGVSGNQG